MKSCSRTLQYRCCFVAQFGDISSLWLLTTEITALLKEICRGRKAKSVVSIAAKRGWTVLYPLLIFSHYHMIFFIKWPLMCALIWSKKINNCTVKNRWIKCSNLFVLISENSFEISYMIKFPYLVQLNITVLNLCKPLLYLMLHLKKS